MRSCRLRHQRPVSTRPPEDVLCAAVARMYQAPPIRLHPLLRLCLLFRCVCTCVQLIVGPVSSIFDLITFLVNWYIFGYTNADDAGGVAKAQTSECRKNKPPRVAPGWSAYA